MGWRKRVWSHVVFRHGGAGGTPRHHLRICSMPSKSKIPNDDAPAKSNKARFAMWMNEQRSKASRTHAAHQFLNQGRAIRECCRPNKAISKASISAPP